MDTAKLASSNANKKDNIDTQVIYIEEKVANPNGEPTIKKYSRGKFLGKGGFAKCYEFTSLEDNHQYAAKIVPKASLQKSRQRAKMLSEIKIHRSLTHTNIVKFEHVFEDGENVYILLELCTNQTLNELIKRRRRLTDLEVQSYTLQIISALKYLHNNKIIHRDLKLGNLFQSDGLELKLGDFGLAAKLEFESEKRHTVCGTPNYIAPEILENKGGHGYAVDIWSLGVIIYTLTVGKPPFETPDVKSTYKKIKMCSYSFPDHVPLTESLKNMISRIFILDPSKRLTISECITCPFINNGNEIPKNLPLHTLACPPSSNFLKQFAQNNDSKTKFDLTKSTGFGQSSKQMNSETNNAESLNKKNIASGTNPKQLASEIYVKKWVDYSSKYGLGYSQSNGCAGVFFNDCTKVILNPDNEYFEYIERRASDKTDAVSCYTVKNYPKQLAKKMTLVQNFRTYLQGGKTQTYEPSEKVEQYKHKEVAQIYQKKWMKTRHAIMFRLSNKIVQVDFQDKTKIVLSSESKLVTYVNKKGETSQYPIATALESDNPEMAKRLKYTKDILTHMLNNNQNAADKVNV